jgi:hypothetical protein
MSMAEKKKSTAKVTVSKKTVRDLKLKPGKSDSLKGGIIGYPRPGIR